MTSEHDDLESLLRGTFEATAHAAVGDARPVPHFDAGLARVVELPVRRRAWAAPLLAAAAVAAVAIGGLVAVTMSRSGHDSPNAAVSRPPVSEPPTSVHITSTLSDNQTVGVGMPLVLRFSAAPSSAHAFVDNTRVLLNGKPAAGAWFWQASNAPGAKMEAQYRQQNYWPAHATITMSAPVKSLSAGANAVGKPMTYDNDISLVVKTGDAHVTTVDATTHLATCTSDGKPVKSMRVSVGGPGEQTTSGTKVVLEKDRTHQMTAPEYPTNVDYAVRLTTSGEFAFAAPPGLVGKVGKMNASGGGSLLLPADAQWFYNWSQLGDVVRYKNTGGSTVPSWDGYAGWNLDWTYWKTGGLLKS